MGGNYGSTLERRLAACDTVIFLGMPRLLCLRRYRGRSPLELSPQRRLVILRQLSELGAGQRVVVLRSRMHVDELMEKVHELA